ncbi:MAG: ATP-dependent zinc metalloprotease FtsH [Acetobacteraceae bacterium]
MNKKTHFNMWYAIAAFVGVIAIQSLFLARTGPKEVPYSQFIQLLEAGKISAVTVSENHLEGTPKTPLPKGPKSYATTRVSPATARLLDKYHVTVTGVVTNHVLADILGWFIPAIIFFAIWMFVIRRFAGQQGIGGLMQIGKSKAKIFVEKDTNVKFSDVAGVDEAKEELAEVVAFLKEPKLHARLGARIPKGILLVGPPGTGKTLLARAVAGEARVPFFSISGSEFVEMFVGVGAARVRDLFEQARKVAPCIIFIDELDALGRARGAGPFAGGHDEKEQTLNQLLMELDGFDPQTGIVLIGATNRPEVLDPALLRAGRLDRQVLVDRPDRLGRVAILLIHLKRVTLGADVDPTQIAALTPGFTGADLANLVNEAALQATRRNADAVAMTDFTRAFERIVAGLEKKNRLLIPSERRVVAYHEMGHALVAMALPGMDPIHKISIIPRGISALGYTMQRPIDDRFLLNRGELRSKMAVLLGGRAAEALTFEDISTGAVDDIDKATEIARNMVTRFGMSDQLGQVAYETRRPGLLGTMPAPAYHDYSEETAREIDCAVRDLIADAFDTATQILTLHKAELHEGAELLLRKETLLREELPRLRDAPQATPEPAALAPPEFASSRNA